MSTALQSTASAAGAIKRVTWSQDAMIDLMIQNPLMTQNQIASHFGYTPGWVSRVINSDAFQARLAERKTEIVDPTILMTIEEKAKALATKSLDVVMEKISMTNDANMAMKVVDTFARTDIYGARKRQEVPTQQHYVVLLPAKVESSDDWASQHAPQPKSIQAEIIQEN